MAKKMDTSKLNKAALARKKKRDKPGVNTADETLDKFFSKKNKGKLGAISKSLKKKPRKK
jgi:hypothetical protein